MSTDTLFVRFRGLLIPVNQVSLVQVNPNKPHEVVQEMPLTRPLEDLIEYNLTAFVKIHDTRREWQREMDGKDAGRTERG